MRVRIDPSTQAATVGPRFAGLSFEALDLPQVAQGAERGPLVRLLASLGPGVLRFGGSSVDTRTTFSAAGVRAPGPGTTIVPQDLDRLGVLSRATGWRVLLGVNLGGRDAVAAASEVAAAARSLGPGLAAVEIGNEPNTFAFDGLRPGGWGYLPYRDEIEAYRRAIAAVAPSVPIAGPDTIDAFSWLAAYARQERPALLTPHQYPLSNCGPPAPTIDALLSPAGAGFVAAALRALATVGRRSGIPVRVGEVNNVACRGRTGVSDTFAAALWALRYQLAVARAGLTGVNFHTLPECGGYSPLCFRTPADAQAGLLHATPEWYALLLFSRLAGDRFVGASISPHPDALTVDVLRRPLGRAFDVVADNSGAAPARLAILPCGARCGPGRWRAAKVLRLRAPALEATSQIRLGGRPVGRDGSWRPRHLGRRPADPGGTIHVRIPAAGAALIRVSVGPMRARRR